MKGVLGTDKVISERGALQYSKGWKRDVVWILGSSCRCAFILKDTWCLQHFVLSFGLGHIQQYSGFSPGLHSWIAPDRQRQRIIWETREWIWVDCTQDKCSAHCTNSFAIQPFFEKSYILDFTSLSLSSYSVTRPVDKEVQIQEWRKMTMTMPKLERSEWKERQQTGITLLCHAWLRSGDVGKGEQTCWDVTARDLGTKHVVLLTCKSNVSRYVEKVIIVHSWPL